MPAGDPWQKEGRWITSGEHRLEMARLAVETVERIEVDGREFRRDGPTFTSDTLETFPDDEELFLVLGADAAAGLRTWHRYQEVLDRTTVLVLPRPGTTPDAVAAAAPDAVYLDMAILEISGTELREMARDGDPFRFLVTAPVYDYIIENDLYMQVVEADRVGASSETEEVS